MVDSIRGIWKRGEHMYEYDSRVRLTEVDQNQKMTLTGILNAFQDCSIFHSEDLGVGFLHLEGKKRMWVLRSWDIRIFRRPVLAEHIRVGTWPCAFGKVTGQRNFRLLDGRGELAACGDSSWVYMDTERMRPARVEEEIRLAYQMEPRLSLFGEQEAIAVPEKFTEEESFVIHARHLDVNHHVNNGQYVRFAAEYLPEGFRIGRMRAEYKKSAVLNDRICPCVSTEKDLCTILFKDASGKLYTIIEFRQE